MALTGPQLVTLKAHIDASPDLSSQPNTTDGNDAVAKLLNLVDAPDYWVWRTAVPRAEIYNNASPTGSAWNWTTYKNQGVSEQNAWTQMFMGDVADFSKLNLRTGIGAIFTGSGAANDQRDHCLATGRRKAKRGERVLATGTGSTATPAIMGFEGTLSYQDVTQARELP
jgi:hypothetical protein